MSGKPKGTTGNNSPLFYIYTVIFYLYYYVKKALSLEYNAGIQYFEHVLSASKSVIQMDNGTTIPISRHRYKEFNDAFFRFLER